MKQQVFVSDFSGETVDETDMAVITIKTTEQEIVLDASKAEADRIREQAKLPGRVAKRRGRRPKRLMAEA